MTERPAEAGRDDLAAAIYSELTRLVRRIRGEASELHPGLSLAAYTLLLYLSEVGEARAADLVAFFRLNKSTVSRQLAELVTAGLVDREPNRADSRVQIVRVSAFGQATLDDVDKTLRARMRARLDSWPEEDMAAFGRLLARYNELPDPQLPRPDGAAARGGAGRPAAGPSLTA
ncbi:MarR family winged helix-turn-helix transcriptional regulator [Frankia nepalensis]|uniref:Winged helix-turn-helix transcriptional regulator n=1 Tax=Frankia nepalensis TaxID=1836974 RepID=A0A937R7N0_9ACTN|nr:MarR family winged helix-turn-helix transcriptional regulator [Frankia nepalensis]MBL7499615.1 winged helix-turn-helix transcriptional regulator [Frankia nepalensis]MBL7514538.1 winged helix-turn-helix transcriptional regulator [Frankia nepalensis]MBL7626841.1 winged helix-turn-helix transcriptional regulator [Frankia nepalensis]